MAAVEHFEDDQPHELKRKIVDRELERMTKKLKRVPTAEEILEAARVKTNPLHSYFEWNDSVAAEAHRLDTARRLLRLSEYITQIQEYGETRRLPVRKFVSIHRGEPMKLRTEVLDNDEIRAEMVKRAIGELRSWCKRYVDVPELTALRRLLEQEIGKE